jgi:tyrosine-protein phosphatase SIW14
VIYEWLKNLGGLIIGLLELVGLKYPVRTYMFRVTDTLWRGSRLPNDAAYRELEDRGCKLIVSLCAENDMDAIPADKVGLKHFRIPIIDNTHPTESQMFEFLWMTTDPHNWMVMVHCEAGKGRTGVAVACYRMAICDWPFEKALAEAKQFGLTLECQEKFLKEFSVDGVIKWKKTGGVTRE